MAKRMTTAEARREWAKVLRSAERGTSVEVTRNGQAVAAVVPIREYRMLVSSNRETFAGAVAWFRNQVDPADLEGPDPWAAVRDPSPGRNVEPLK